LIVVIDASVAVKWFLPERSSPEAGAFLEPRFEPIAPDLLSMEVASALLRALRRGLLQPTDAQAALDRLSSAVEMFPSEDLVRPALVLAAEHGGSLFDGVYVAMAAEAVVVSDDARLLSTATAAGVRCIHLADGPPTP
jgi:predicted nucleic acid-binding protein